MRLSGSISPTSSPSRWGDRLPDALLEWPRLRRIRERRQEGPARWWCAGRIER